MSEEYLVEIIRRANEFVKYSSEFWPSELKREINAILESKEMRGAKFDREYAKKCVATGWHGLVDELFDLAKKENFTVAQVKEKYGILRIYVDDANMGMHIKIDNLERRSANMCEICGKAGERISRGGWLKTRCWTHV